MTCLPTKYDKIVVAENMQDKVFKKLFFVRIGCQRNVAVKISTVNPTPVMFAVHRCSETFRMF